MIIVEYLSAYICIIYIGRLATLGKKMGIFWEKYTKNTKFSHYFFQCIMV